MSEIMKLILILGSGLFILLIGFINIKKKKDKDLDSIVDYSGSDSKNANFSPYMSPGEEKVKNYIIQYKDSYPRESLKVSLVNSGNSEGDVNVWLDKYL